MLLLCQTFGHFLLSSMVFLYTMTASSVAIMNNGRSSLSKERNS